MYDDFEAIADALEMPRATDSFFACDPCSCWPYNDSLSNLWGASAFLHDAGRESLPYRSIRTEVQRIPETIRVGPF